MTGRCGMRSCAWRGDCPHHGTNAPLPVDDRLIRHRPHQGGRGGGRQIPCDACGRWISESGTPTHWCWAT